MWSERLAIDALAHVNPRQTSFMRRDHVSVGAWVPLDAMSPLLIAAIVRSEDPRFFQHHGIDWQAIGAQLRALPRTRRLAGGASTITQQLARNLYLTPTRSIARKVTEGWLARRIDRRLTKDRILELYLNTIEWGPDVWGCAAASDYYFRKHPGDLHLFDSTLLATLLPAPKAGLSGRHADRSRSTQVTLAHQLLFLGLTDAEACARCCARLRTLHRLLAKGMPLRQALDCSEHVSAGADARFVHDVLADLHIARAPSLAILSTRACDSRVQQAFTQLCARFGTDAVREVLSTGSYVPLQAHADPSRLP